VFNLCFLCDFLFNFGGIAADFAHDKYEACREVANRLVRVSFQNCAVCWNVGEAIGSGTMHAAVDFTSAL
jgi:hypothetical protein